MLRLRRFLSLALLFGGPHALAQAAPTSELSVLVFYDENGNGVLDPGENVRLPNVRVVVGASSALTNAAGVAALLVPAGEQQVSVAQASLPAYYESPLVATVSVPLQSQVLLPVSLPLDAANRPNTYMAVGDSITVGDGSRGGQGYRAMLEGDLRALLGGAQLINEGIDGTQSRVGLELVDEALWRRRPAYALIHYGTNDWNAIQCKGPATNPCFTVPSLRDMVRKVKSHGSLPILATIIPVNAGRDARVPPERNDWVASVNDLIRAMAAEEGVVVADAWKAFVSSGVELPALFADHVHPNDAGYRLLADAFYEAITRPRATDPPR
jgi:lysophospholipase L1-like esterase